MKIAPGTPLKVGLAFGPGEQVAVGRLVLDGNVAVLEYDREFDPLLSINPQFDPTAVLHRARAPAVFSGLHGVLADSLPDAWGDLLVRRRALANDVSYNDLTVLDRLAIVGRRGFGALVYEPAIEDAATSAIDLDELAGEANAVLEGTARDVLAELERVGGSSGGTRPKVLVAMNQAGGVLAGDAEIPDGYRAWIVKFRSARYDPLDVGPLEAAYADMAREAGVLVSPTRLIETAKGRYFATERFDRLPGGARLHAASAAGLTETDWQMAQIDYEVLLRLTRSVTRDERAIEQMFARMIFNVYANNRDDHAKQHAFLMDDAGTWSLSPAFDLTFSRGYQTANGNEHYLAVDGRGGDDITRDGIAKVGRTAGIAQARIDAIVERVETAVGRFALHAKTYDVGASGAREIGKALESTRRRLG